MCWTHGVQYPAVESTEEVLRVAGEHTARLGVRLRQKMVRAGRAVRLRAQRGSAWPELRRLGGMVTPIAKRDCKQIEPRRETIAHAPRVGRERTA